MLMPLRMLIAISLLPSLSLAALPSTVSLELPANGSSTVIPTPHLSWSPVCDPIAVNAECSYIIEIATDVTFTEVILRDNVEAVITRFIPAHVLLPDTYYWRISTKSAVGHNLTATSAVWSFSVARPTHIINIPTTASFDDMQHAFQAAQSGHTPTLVQFPPRLVRTLDPGNATSFLSLSDCSDVVVDFNGAVLTFISFVNFVSVTDSQRVAVLNLTVDLKPLPYTALHVTSVDETSFTGTVAAGHPEPELLQITNRPKGEVMNGATTRTKRGVIEVVTFSTKWTKTGNSYQVPLLADPAATGIAVGDVFVMGERTGPPGFLVQGGNEVALVGLVAYACANECFTSKYADKLAILNCGLELLPGRFKAANDGGQSPTLRRCLCLLASQSLSLGLPSLCLLASQSLSLGLSVSQSLSLSVSVSQSQSLWWSGSCTWKLAWLPTELWVVSAEHH